MVGFNINSLRRPLFVFTNKVPRCNSPVEAALHHSSNCCNHKHYMALVPDSRSSICPRAEDERWLLRRRLACAICR